MKIRAAVLEEFGQPLEVQEIDLAEPKAGEVLVRLVACGVCHTDLYTASGADPSGYAPAVLGHEGAGVVDLFAADPPTDEYGTQASVLGLATFTDGAVDARILGYVHGHGSWLAWTK